MDHLSQFWPKEVHFGPFRSANRTLAIPEYACVYICGKRPLVHKIAVHNFLCPLTPPPPNQQSDGFPLEFLVKGPQTELRTLSQKLRTNNIMNKRAFLNVGNWRNSVLRALFRKRGRENLLSSAAISVSSVKNLVSSFWHINNRLKGAH